MTNLQLVLDEKGFPALADVAPSGVSQVDPNARSGNPRHDTRSGKFGAGGGKRGKAPPAPAGTDPLEYHRMLDAARDAAREFDTPQEGDIREFLQGRAKNPGQVDVQGFLDIVAQMRMNDLVDGVDQAMRRGGSMPQGRRKVRISFPKGFFSRSIKLLGEDQIAEVMHRLEARGHDAAEVEKFFHQRHDQATVDSAKAKRDTIAASEQWQADPLDDILEADDAQDGDLLTLAEIVKSFPQPIINVQLPPATALKNTPVRDENGLILYSVQEPVGPDAR